MNLDRIEALLQLVHEADVAEVIVEGEGWRVGARKGPASSATVAEPTAPVEAAPPAPAEEAADPQPILAGLVGWFRAVRPAVAVGDHVEAGQALGGIESMGILNPIMAPHAGEIAAVAVADGQGVHYAQELFRLLPNGTAPAPLLEEEAIDEPV
jgi:biotin carboxyl carrier protein